ncbi:MAG: hypothetical protein E6209_07475 [Finegoldia magna]|uniref:Uncharacterized protein n=1 Tax=Finegoldia magna (strain ATCC 29328 / DSM 20472 / WAL 2508) TaxID=334413 RepID=B0S357_FINM2|nr:hypothetical protein [Finegoldia magna]BAG08797.1 hypothetical protein FMG_1379 [Finegoldia magna ATCC 29328]
MQASTVVGAFLWIILGRDNIIIYKDYLIQVDMLYNISIQLT